MNYSTQKCSIKKSLSGTSYLLRKFRAYILIKPFNVYLKTLYADPYHRILSDALVLVTSYLERHLLTSISSEASIRNHS